AMPAHLSQQLRERILSWAIDDELSISDIANLAGCSKTTVYEVLRVYREYGQTESPFVHPRGRHRALDTDDLNYILSLVETNPAVYLDEIQNQLLDIHNV
ncbi:hypothetical protein BC835DRAFT_1212005, partial [Cytidiella melzeri]